ncbi:uncharacterized protein LOC135365813 isoform X2 [Ornithodoros turicata]
MFSIVHFDERDEVSVVPSTWLMGRNKVLWPPYKNSKKVAVAIKACENPSSNWSQHNCRVLYECDTYETARQKEQKAAMTSDLTTDDDMCEPKRKRWRPQRFESSDEESASIMGDSSCFVNKPEVPVSRSQATPQCIRRPRPLCLSASRVQGAVSTSEPSPKSSTVSAESQQQEIQKSRKSTPEEKTLKMLKGIKMQLSSQAALLERLEKAILTSTPTGAPDPPQNDILEQLPLSAVECLEKLESDLHNPKNRTDLGLYLSRIGGSSPQDCLRHIMRRCMNDSFAQGFCLTGRKGKRPFLGLRLLEVIYGAVRKSYPEVTDATLQSCVADWLRYAPSRVKKS